MLVVSLVLPFAAAPPFRHPKLHGPGNNKAAGIRGKTRRCLESRGRALRYALRVSHQGNLGRGGKLYQGICFSYLRLRAAVDL